ncbi:MAG: hypothetical protein Q8O40_07995 [Chloroflexota bacterium]|nr:hypothetical protein [Chloroflexota bacterium]
MTVKPNEESVRAHLASHLFRTGNAMTEWATAVSAGQPVTRAMLNQAQRCWLVAVDTWGTFIEMDGKDWERAAVFLNRLDADLAAQARHQKEESDGN